MVRIEELSTQRFAGLADIEAIEVLELHDTIETLDFDLEQTAELFDVVPESVEDTLDFTALGSCNFLISLRTNPVWAKEVLEKGLVIK